MPERGARETGEAGGSIRSSSVSAVEDKIKARTQVDQLTAYDRKAYRVGIEWPQDRGTNLDESFRECFREAEVELSPRREGGGDGGRPRTWWFFGYPAGDDWVGWDRLLVKTNEEIPQFVSTTVDFMKRLAEVIDRSDLP